MSEIIATDLEHYVYIHRRMSDGKVFYVGKGKGRRAYEKHNRSEWWKAIERKHGRIVDFYIEGVSDQYAKYLEVKLIDMFAYCGVELVNMTVGGDGCSGYSHSDKSIKSIKESNNPNTVYSSTGQAYDGLSSAVAHMIELGYVKASASNISYSCSGKILTAYDRRWSYEWFPEHLEGSARDRQKKAAAKALSKPVQTSFGEYFQSAMDAQRWLRVNGYPKASNSSIISCIKGKQASAYGRKWFNP